MTDIAPRSGNNAQIFADQLKKISTAPGFIAALDQSGGSTPKALAAYGVTEDAFANDAEMFDLIHAMRTRIMTSPAFSGDRIVGAILFEMTMDREVEGVPTPSYLWQQKQVVPFLKVDKGLADESDGVQVMKPIPELDSLLSRARELNVFGTKMRSVIKSASASGIARVVEQQFEIAERIRAHQMVPIIEPEVDIHASDKAECEALLHAELARGLNGMSGDTPVMFKLTLPESPNFYAEFVKHDEVARVVALSGGYSREEANRRLAANNGMIASFSRALTEGLSANQSDAEFNATLNTTIADIAGASNT